MTMYLLLFTSVYTVVAFAPVLSPVHHQNHQQLQRTFHNTVKQPKSLAVLTMTSASSEDVMDWFLNKPASPIFMAMAKKLSADMWDPLKYQLDAVPVFYCGIEDVRPTVPFKCFLDIDEAKEELQSQMKGKGINTKLDLIPMMLGDAYENTSMQYSTLNPSSNDRCLAFSPDMEGIIEEGDVPIFGVKVLQQEEKDGEFICGLTDRLYFDGEQAQKVLKAIIDEQGSEDIKFDIFVVSLNKALEYMIVDKESDFKFEFVPPQSTLDYISSKYDIK